MTNNVALEVAIGLILMYLMLSLLCTVINEFIATQLNLRAKSLAAALTALLDDPAVRRAFYDQGAIASINTALKNERDILLKDITVAAAGPPQAHPQPAQPSKAETVARNAANDFAPTGTLAGAIKAPQDASAVGPAISHPDSIKHDEHPSYISSETFVQTLIGGLVGTRLPNGEPIPTFDDIKSTIAKLPPSNIKSVLLSILVTTGGNVDAFRKKVATWFDDAMERLSGAYKRHLKFISIVVASIVAIAFNANTFRVADVLWNDKELRGRIVDQAADLVKQADGSDSFCHLRKPDATPSGHQPAADINLATLRQSVQATEDCLRPFPIGWTADARANWHWRLVPIALSILGWLVTALALTLGAPFWFDLLVKFVNIRGTGPRPPRADSKTA